MHLVDKGWALPTAATSEYVCSVPPNVCAQWLVLQHPYGAATVLDEWCGIPARRASSSAHVWDRTTDVLAWPGLSPLTMKLSV